MLERKTLRVQAGGGAPPGVVALTARIIQDSARLPARPVVLCCFPGGGISARYFELDGADMAAYLADRGFVVVLVDHAGTCASDVPHDPWTLRPELVADLDAAAVRHVVGGLGFADPILVGVGHSMGAMLLAYQQARHRLYNAVALLGHSGRGLPEVLTREELAVAGEPDKARLAIADLAMARFGRPLAPSGSGVSAMLTGLAPGSGTVSPRGLPPSPRCLPRGRCQGDSHKYSIHYVTATDESAPPLRPAPAITEDNLFYWEAARDGRLVAQRRGACGRLRHPPRTACPHCQSLDIEIAELSGDGEIYSYALLWHPRSPRFDYPVIAILVDLTEGIRVVSNLVGAEPGEVRIGLPVTVEFQRCEGELAVPVFRPRTEAA